MVTTSQSELVFCQLAFLAEASKIIALVTGFKVIVGTWHVRHQSFIGIKWSLFLCF